jgi:hypothetical protein
MMIVSEVIMVRINKTQAEKICGVAPAHGETLLGIEGVKVSAKKRGCVTLYFVYGYAFDGSDVSAALAI